MEFQFNVNILSSRGLFRSRNTQDCQRLEGVAVSSCRELIMLIPFEGFLFVLHNPVQGAAF